MALTPESGCYFWGWTRVLINWYAAISFFQSIALIKKCLPCSFVVLQISKWGFQSSSCTVHGTRFGYSAATEQDETKTKHTNGAVFFKIHLKFSFIKYSLWLIGGTRFLNRLTSVRPHEPDGIFYLNPCFLYFYYVLMHTERNDGASNIFIMSLAHCCSTYCAWV